MDLFRLDALFLFVLNQSIVASYVIIGVLFVRLLLKRAPKVFSYALWGVVLVRLLCPFSIESSVSLIPVSAQPITQSVLYTVLPGGLLGLPVLDDADGMNTDPFAAVQDNLRSEVDETIMQGNVSNNVNAATAQENGNGNADAATQESASNTTNNTVNATTQGGAQVGAQSNAQTSPNAAKDTARVPNAHGAADAIAAPIWLSMVGWGWLLGVACLLLYSLVSLLRLRSALANALPLAPQAQTAALMEHHIPCNVYYSAQVETAFVLGVLRPKIYLPALLSRAEMQYILCHEQTHIRRGDHVIKFVAFLVLCLHWFNPLVWVAFFLCGKDMELSCDEWVIQTLGHGVKQEYSASLLSLATGKRILGGAPLAFGEGDTKSRIQNVLRYRKPALWVSVLAVLCLFCAGIALLTTKQNKAVEIDAAPLMQEIRVALGEATVPEETKEIQLSLAQEVVQSAVDILNEAGKAPSDGSNPYYVTDAIITELAPQNTGAATEYFAIGMYALGYQITLSTTDHITLPEGFQLVANDAAVIDQTGDMTAQTLVCTPTNAAQPYLYLFGGTYDDAASWQSIGVLTYDEIDRWYGGPASLSYYGDCRTASANELLGDCFANDVDFEKLHFAAPDGILIDTTAPSGGYQNWQIDFNHDGKAEHIGIDKDNMVEGEYSEIFAILERTEGEGGSIALHCNASFEAEKQQPSLYGIYTDAAGDEFLFLYYKELGAGENLGDVRYCYQICDITPQDTWRIVASGDDRFTAEEIAADGGAGVQQALDVINGYMKNTCVILSTDDSLQYYGVHEGAPVTVQFSDGHALYINAQDIRRAIYVGESEYRHYDVVRVDAECAPIEGAGVGSALYAQVVPE